MKPRFTGSHQPLASGWVGGLALMLAGSVWGADQIEYSKKPAKLDLPPQGGAMGTSRPFDFLKPSSPAGGFVEPLPNPLMNKPNMSKKLFEYLDQKKNWMFVNPKEAAGKTSLQEMFKVQEESLSWDGAKPKKSVEKFLEGDDKDKSEGTNNVSNTSTNETTLTEDKPKTGEGETERRVNATAKGDAPQNESPSSNPRKDSPSNVGRLGEVSGGLNPGPTGRAEFGLGGFGGNNPVLSKNPENALSMRQQQQLRDDRTSRMLQSPLGALSGGDPINVRGDSTSVPANPTLPIPSVGVAARPPLPRPASLSGIESGSGSLPTGSLPARASALEELTSRTFNVSSPNSPSFTPASATTFQPRPPVLEFPKRRF
ncbi:MAG: hypothetical protein FJ404_02590 [Verrucomicrobia bacterium]|nr:hypothetical protein [Verrucomicrobiota bacterium]